MIGDHAQLAAKQGKKLVVLFQDEARFGRVQDPKRCWCPRKVRPLVRSQLVRQYTYAYGAINPLDGTLISMILPRADSLCMNVFLNEVREVYPEDYIVVFMDRAAWHRSKSLEVPSIIQIEYLPPYSPELNPVEMAWKIIRNGFFHNVYFHSLEAVQKRLYEALTHHWNQKHQLASACSYQWIINPILNAA